MMSVDRTFSLEEFPTTLAEHLQYMEKLSVASLTHNESAAGYIFGPLPRDSPVLLDIVRPGK